MTHPHPRALEAATEEIVRRTGWLRSDCEDIARAAVTAYLAEAGDGWMPIETAPKDGTRVLLYPGGAFTARWSEECQFGQFKTAPGWQIFECEDPYYSVAEDEPTHWRPLPAPPAAQDRRP